MGCLKLAYNENNDTLKVAHSSCKENQKYCTGAYRYGFNGQEKDDEISGSGNSNTAEFWQYDTRLGRRWNIDPIRKAYYSGYSTFANNPIVYADPDGLKEKNQKDANAKKDVEDGDTYSDKDGKRFQYNGEIGAWNAQETGGLNTGGHNSETPPSSTPTGNANKERPLEFSIPTDKDGLMCMDCVNPATTHNNILGTYPGGNNPLSWNQKSNYSYMPEHLYEYPAIGHDRRYDNLKATGALGLLIDIRTIGADALFVKEQFDIAHNSSNPILERVIASMFGNALGAVSMQKTLIKLSQGPKAWQETMMYFIISNQGVTNTPDVHNHSELKKKYKIKD